MAHCAQMSVTYRKHEITVDCNRNQHYTVLQLKRLFIFKGLIFWEKHS